MSLIIRCSNTGRNAMAVLQEGLNLGKGKLNRLQIADYPRRARRLASTTPTKTENAETLKCAKDQQHKSACSSTQHNVTLFTDATPSQGAWVNQHESASIFLVPPEFQNSSFEYEYYSAYRGIMDNAAPGKSIHLYCDSQNVCGLLERGKARSAKLKKLNQDLQSALRANNVSLAVSWIPSKENPADKLSRSRL